MAFEYFLRVDGIPAESTDKKHAGEIAVESFSWGETNAGSAFGGGGGGGAGRVQMQDLHVTAHTSKAGPDLLLACASGTHIKSAVLSARRAGAKQPGDFLTFSLSDVLVTSYQTGGSETEQPRDQVSLSFGRIEVAYKEQKADGSFGASTDVVWDVTKNSKA
jgi:type VI secretion system secreted protein Hcp